MIPRRPLFPAITIVAALWLVWLPAQATEHPVNDVAGLVAAADRLAPGDSIVIAAGTYHLEATLSLWASGTAEQPIEVRAASGARPVIDGSQLTASAINIIGITGDHVQLIGLEVAHTPTGSGSSGAGGIAIWGASGCVIRDCRVHDAWKAGIFVGGSDLDHSSDHQVIDCEVYHTVRRNDVHTWPPEGWDQGISVGPSRRVSVVRCRVYENQGEGIGCFLADQARVVACVSHDNFGTNIYLDNATRTLVDGNLAYSTGKEAYFRRFGEHDEPHAATGIQFSNEFYELSNPLDEITVVNNVLVGNHVGIYYGAYQVGGGIKRGSIAHNTIVGSTEAAFHLEPDAHSDTHVLANIIVQNQGLLLQDLQGRRDAAPGGIAFAGNCWWGSILETDFTGLGSGAIVADPLLVDPGSHQIGAYELLPGSPARDAWTEAPVVDHDALDRMRPLGAATDLGALEMPTTDNQAPRILSGPSATPAPVTGTTAQLTVEAEDPDGDALSYAWSVTAHPDGAQPTVGDGATPTARFDRAGSYTIRVLISDGHGAEVSASLDLLVEQVPSGVQVQPLE